MEEKVRVYRCLNTRTPDSKSEDIDARKNALQVFRLFGLL